MHHAKDLVTMFLLNEAINFSKIKLRCDINKFGWIVNHFQYSGCVAKDHILINKESFVETSNGQKIQVIQRTSACRSR